MKRFFVDFKINVDDNVVLQDELYNNIINVLRLTKGENIILFNGTNIDYVCEIADVLKKSVVVKVLNECENNVNPKVNVALFQALVKGEKFELVTQKITEIGVSELIPFESEFVQVKGNTTKINRLPKITIEACKQCGRSIPVKIHDIVKFDKMVEMLKNYDEVVFAYENEKTPLDIKPITAKNIAIVVGGEGGFSINEAQKIKNLKNVKCVSLGSRVLRAETAAITLSSNIMLLSKQERS